MPAEGDWGPPDSAHMAEDHDLENSQGRRGVPYGQRDYPSPSLVEVRQAGVSWGEQTVFLQEKSAPTRFLDRGISLVMFPTL